MSGNAWWSTKVSEKLLSDLVIFSIFSSENPLDFHESIQVNPLKYLTFFLAGINTKQFWNIPEEKYFAPLRILNLSIKSFVNPFVDIALTFFDSFNSFFFDVTSFILLTKLPKLFTKLAYHFCLLNLLVLVLQQTFLMLTLNSGVLIYLSCLWSVIFFSMSLIFVL